MEQESDAIRKIREMCMRFPETEEKPFGGHSAPSFRVRDKLFAVISEDGTNLTLKGGAGVQQALVASDSERYYVPKYVGHHGWIGIQLEREGSEREGSEREGSELDWTELAELIEESYRMTAPKRLVAEIDT